MKIDVRSAVIAAKEYLESIQDVIGSIDDILLEEVELSENKSFWYVTLSFNRSLVKKERSFITGIELVTQHERHYKLFTVDAVTGEVNSMKIREI
jgi:hypothetical protein